MNEYQQNLYRDLRELTKNSEAFFSKLFEQDDGRLYEIFNYRLASYTDFCQPSALEARGIMFEVEEGAYDMVPIRLACLPPSKFFNYRENPFTMEVDFDRAVAIHDKADGSLISTYLDANGDVRLKTKGSLFSDQVYQAEKFLFLDSPNQIALAEDVCHLTELGFTINMEWCSPNNRIVLGYESSRLQVFNVRSLHDGSYVSREEIRDIYNCQAISDNWVYEYDIDDMNRFVAELPEIKDIEGVVITLDDDQQVKLKTNWYLARHHTKDSINTPRRLFEAVLEEATDDMKSMFWHDQAAIEQIEAMEQFVDHKYNHMVAQVEDFYEANKDLDRKSYAIKGQQELDKMHFSLAMKKYQNIEPDYKQFLKSQWKKLGLKDEKEDFDEH